MSSTRPFWSLSKMVTRSPSLKTQPTTPTTAAIVNASIMGHYLGEGRGKCLSVPKGSTKEYWIWRPVVGIGLLNLLRVVPPFRPLWGLCGGRGRNLGDLRGLPLHQDVEEGVIVHEGYSGFLGVTGMYRDFPWRGLGLVVVGGSPPAT